MPPDFYKAANTPLGCQPMICIVRTKDGRLVARNEPHRLYMAKVTIDAESNEVCLRFPLDGVDFTTLERLESEWRASAPASEAPTSAATNASPADIDNAL